MCQVRVDCHRAAVADEPPATRHDSDSREILASVARLVPAVAWRSRNGGGRVEGAVPYENGKFRFNCVRSSYIIFPFAYKLYHFFHCLQIILKKCHITKCQLIAGLLAKLSLVRCMIMIIGKRCNALVVCRGKHSSLS